MTFASGTFECDNCGDTIETRRDFKAGWEIAKARGWRAYIGPDKQFAHACPKCTKDFADEQRRR